MKTLRQIRDELIRCGKNFLRACPKSFLTSNFDMFLALF